MTIPHLSNCEHHDSGWCLGCVRDLWDEKQLAQTQVSALQKDVSDLVYLDGEAQLGADEVSGQNYTLRARILNAKIFIQNRVCNGDQPSTYNLSLNHDQVCELNQILSYE